MSCPIENCPIKPFFSKVLEQLQDFYKPPFKVPKDMKDFENQLKKNLKRKAEFYMFVNGLCVFIGSLLAHPFFGILVLAAFVAIAFTWDKYLKQHIEKFFVKNEITFCVIPTIVAVIVLLPAAIFAEKIVGFVLFIILAVLLVLAHASFHAYGTKEMLADAAEKKAKEMKKGMEKAGKKMEKEAKQMKKDAEKAVEDLKDKLD